MATYNPQLVNLTVKVHDDSGVANKTFRVRGFSEGTMIDAQRSSDSWSNKVSADGTVRTRSRQASKDGTITFTLEEGAPSNSDLTAVIVDDEKFGEDGGKAICTVEITDHSGNESAVGRECSLMRPANQTKGNESQSREWVFAPLELEIYNEGM